MSGRNASLSVEDRQANHSIDVMGIVTNGEGWKFYKLILEADVYETPTYSIGDLNLLLGRLHYVFQACERNLDIAQDLDIAKDLDIARD